MTSFQTLPVPGAQGAQHPERSRIRDPGKITMVRDSTPAETGKLYPHAGPLLSARWNEDWSLTAGATSCAWPGR
jgi:hypothetical protein